MKTILLLPFLLFSFCGRAQSADDIVNNYITATGGHAAWQKTRTIITQGTYDYGGIVFPFTTYSKRPDKYKVVVPLKGKYFAQSFDGNAGWKIDAFKGDSKKTPLRGAAARNMTNEADVELEPPFIDYQQKGHQLMLDGQDSVAGERCFKVMLHRKNGQAETYYFDATRYLLLRKMAPAKNAELDGALLQTDYSNYKKVGGLLLPFKAVSKTGPQTILTVVVTKVQLNKPVADSIFK